MAASTSQARLFVVSRALSLKEIRHINKQSQTESSLSSDRGFGLRPTFVRPKFRRPTFLSQDGFRRRINIWRVWWLWPAPATAAAAKSVSLHLRKRETAKGGMNSDLRDIVCWVALQLEDCLVVASHSLRLRCSAALLRVSCCFERLACGLVYTGCSLFLLFRGTKLTLWF